MSDAPPTRHWRVLGSSPQRTAAPSAVPTSSVPPHSAREADARAGIPPEPAPAALPADAMPCDRCGTAMFRMHAVWRCPACGFKSDCCGW